MPRVYFTSRADKELSELPQELKQRIYNELKIGDLVRALKEKLER